MAGGVATAETSLGEAVGRIVARGYQSKIRTEVAGPIWDQPVILGSLSPPGGYKSEITLDQHTSAKTEVERAGGRIVGTVHELTVSGIGLPARSSRRTRIAQTVMRKASTAIPAATRNPLEKPTANAWR